jgi:acetolactate synthase-1/2/3 large subunit
LKITGYIANYLLENGVRRVFGVPGGPSIPYIEAMENAGVNFILTSTEAAAAIMADVSARLYGIPGICHATLGPGATNLASGIGGALLDRSPVIAFTSEADERMIHRTSQMNIDHQKLFEPLTKVTFRMNSLNAADVIHEAFRICREEYPGPVHVGLPANIDDSEVENLPHASTAPKSAVNPGDAREIISLLTKARAPLLAVGLTAKRLGIENLLIPFLDKSGVPCVITPMAKGIIDEKHPSYAGVLFHALSDYLGEIIKRCDLVIGIGYDPVEYNYESWLPDVPLIHFDTRQTELPSRVNAVQQAGRPEEWFGILDNSRITPPNPEIQLIKDTRDKISSVFNRLPGHFGPVEAMKTLQDELPDNALIAFDVGSHLHLAGQYWRTGGKQRLLMTNGWSGMGFGIPAALSAKLNLPESTVVCITGDGGFLMMAGELMTARRYNLPVIIVVFSDGELNLIRLKQSRGGFDPRGTILYRGDLFGSDLFLGVKVIKVDSARAMSKALIKALSLREPVIINAIIDPEDYKWLVVK